MSWLSVAGYIFTGTLTSPKDTAPLPIARMSIPLRATSPAGGSSADTDHASTAGWTHAAHARQRDTQGGAGWRDGYGGGAGRSGVAARGQVGRHEGAPRRDGRPGPADRAQRGR